MFLGIDFKQVDKQAHALAGALIAIVVFLYVSLLSGNVAAGWLCAAGAVVIAAFAKEKWDASHPPHESSELDLKATVLGGIAGGIVIAVLGLVVKAVA